MGRPRKPLLSAEEIRRPFEGDGGAAYGPVLHIEQVAALFGVGVGTVRDWLLKARLEGTYRKRGKRLFFWRDKVLELVFNGREWRSDDESNE